MNDSYGTRSIREILRIFFQHWLLILFVLIIVGGGTWITCEMWPAPIYRSRINLIFKQPKALNPITADSTQNPLEVFVKAQQQIVRSDIVLARTKVLATDPSLRDRWYELADDWRDARDSRPTDVAKALADINDFLASSAVQGAVDDMMSNRQAELKDFKDSIKLETPGGEEVAMTETFGIQVDAAAPKDEPNSHLNAMYAADLLADMYMVRYQQLQQELNDPALRVMDEVIARFEREVQAKADAYQAFIDKHSDEIGVLEQLLKSGTEHGVQVVLTKVRENLAKLDLELARDRAISETLKATLPAKAFEPGGVEAMSEREVELALQSVASDFFKEDPLYVELNKELARRQAKFARIEVQFTEASRDYQYMRDEIDRYKRKLLAMVVAHANGMEARVRAGEQQRQQYMSIVDTTAEEQSHIHIKLARYSRLKDSFEAAQDHLAKLQEDRIDAMTNHVRASESVVISKLDQASVPDPEMPVAPLTVIYTIVAVLVALLLGVAGAFLADHFDHTLRSTAEAERYLGVPVVGSIKKRGRRLVLSG